MVVRKVRDGFGFLCDVVEFSHEEKGLEEGPIDTGSVGSAIRFGTSDSLEIISSS